MIRRLNRLVHRPQRGQILLMSALLLPVLLGMTAVAVDLGSYADDRRSVQNAADAIALAAAQDLCNPNPADCSNTTTALATASTYAQKNGINPATMTVTFLGGNTAPKVRVSISHPHQFAFIRVLGVSSQNVGASAAAIKTTPGGVGGLMPWSVLQSVQQAATPGQSVVIKYDARNPTTGNFGAIALDGTGASTYLTTIQNGSTSVVCALGVPNCTTVSPQCSGSTCPTEPGNIIGPTRNGVDYRIANTDPSCSSFDQTFQGPVNGKYQLNSQCNPWVAGSKPSLRVILIPVINSLCNGRCSITILGFAMFYLEGYGPGGCTGNNCEISGRFVNADLTIGALAGTYDPSSSIHFVRLTE